MRNEQKISKLILQEIAKDLNEKLPKGSGFNFYDKMSDVLLENIHRIFITKENDGKGKYLEYRFANFIAGMTGTEISRLETRVILSNAVGEIDVLGFDSNNKPTLIAECKDRPVKHEDVAKWILNTKRVYSDYGGSLAESYFVGSRGYTEGIVSRVETLKEVDVTKGCMKMEIATAKDLVSHSWKWLNNSKGFGETRSVGIQMYEVRQDQFVKIFPKPIS